MAGNTGAWKNVIDEVFSSKREQIANISKYLWENPEISFREYKAHEYLTSFLEKEGFELEKKFVAETGFRAVYIFDGAIAESGDGAGDVKIPNVCFLCEYDATEQVGHAGGHNLWAAGCIAAALSIKECLQKKLFRGKVTILGTPGEDCGCGTKIDMVSQGIFKDIDFCLMLSPLNTHILYPKFYTLLVVKVTYKGKAAHASAFPWEGRNALDAAVACYNNIGLLRQQLKPTWSINGIILSGGVQANVIPEFAELKFWLRAPNQADLMKIQQKCTACFVGAAKATGCEAEFHFEETPYYPMEHNKKLGEIYREHATSQGITFQESSTSIDRECDQTQGSTDFGNVSQVIPCILPSFNVGERVHIHSENFQIFSGTEAAIANTMVASKAIALTAADVMTSSVALDSIKQFHEEHQGSRSAAIMQRWLSQS